MSPQCRKPLGNDKLGDDCPPCRWDFLVHHSPGNGGTPDRESPRPRMRKTIIEDEVDIAEMPPVILSPYVTKSSYL
jgi:hypothetical protein